MLNLYNRNSDLYYKLVKIAELTPEVEMVTNTKYGKYILKSMTIEIIINVLYLFCTVGVLLFSTKNNIFLISHSISSFLIIYEPILLIKNIGIKRLIKKHLHRTLFHLFNTAVIICLVYLYFLDPNDESQKSKYDSIIKILKIFISLRTKRIFVFLNKFRIIQNIYIIIRISKEMLNRNLLTLYSFIIIFSTLSILLTGGNIKKDSFNVGGEIPINYKYLNFNDFASSYISCFCLLMINNLNILVKSLTYKSMNKIFFEFYFATFYFFSTLILINIIQTLLLEMYLISDHSLSDKQIKEEKEKKKENKNDELYNEDDIDEEEDEENNDNENNDGGIKVN